MKINILSPSVYSLISAGQVVENPASVVKELVENSLDAQAQHISIYISKGGLQEIKIVDDGIGIGREDLEKALLPHATSKLSEADDLDAIATYGFRGEALASIASVSTITIKSNPGQEYSGYQITKSPQSETIPKPTPCSFPHGTSVTVSNLFQNVPMRFKFLKTEKSEENHITAIVIQLILANPMVSIEYYIDNEARFHAEGNGLLDAIRVVYGYPISSKMLQCGNSENMIYGYISPPFIVKNNRNFITIIVNNRVIQDPTINSVIQKVYSDYLMTRSFPIVVINIVIPYDDVDVNVHPSKREVRFRNPREIAGRINNLIKTTLYENDSKDSHNLFAKWANEIDIDAERNHKVEVDGLGGPAFKSMMELSAEEFNHTPMEDLLLRRTRLTKKELMYMQMHFRSDTGVKPLLDFAVPESIKDRGTIVFQSKREKEIAREQFSLFPPREENSNFRVLGQVFKTYLVLETKRALLLVDQHAAHERLNFELLMRNYREHRLYRQQMLPPYVQPLTVEDEYQRLLEILEHLDEIGFEIELSKDHREATLKSVPVGMEKIDKRKFFDEILSEDFLFESDVPQIVREKIARASCHASIRAGMELNDMQIQALLNLFAREGITLRCPHGRPIILEFSKENLESMFGRLR